MRFPCTNNPELQADLLPQPSLQRLLSIDKSFETPTQRVEEAARIVGLSLEAPQSTSTTPSYSAQNARLEFVLRWLLEKLMKVQHVPLTTQPWILLRLVLEHMTPSTLARNLSTSQLLVTVTNALADTFPTDRKSTRLNSSHSGESRMPSSA